MIRVTRSIAVVFLFFAVFTALQISVAAGDIDPGFNASVYGSSNGFVNTVKKQPDGKLLIGGFYNSANGEAATSLARLNEDGSVDISFNSQNLFASLGPGATINTIALQADGKILVGGYFYSDAEVAQPGLRRINSDGSIDPAFTTFTIFGGNIFDIELQPDGRIVIAGEFTGPSATQNIARLNSDGTRDLTFATGGAAVKDIELQPDGKIVVGSGDQNSGNVYRLTSVGGVDGTFTSVTANKSVEAVKLSGTGQVIIGGSFTTVNGFTLGRLALLNTDGSIDLSFNQNNSGVNGNTAVSVYDIEPLSNGRMLIGGRFLTYNGVSRKNLAQLNADGSLDSSFDDNSVLINSATLYDIEVLSDGKAVVGTSFSDYPLSVREFNPDGTMVASFAPVFSWSGSVRKIMQQPDGKILVGGSFPFVNGVKRNSLVRLNLDGSTDTSFVPYFNDLPLYGSVGAIALQSDGKILVSSATRDQVLRLNPDGSQDTGFLTPFFGTANDIAVQANGQIVIGGSFGIRRLNANGSHDTSFSVASGLIRKILIQTDGKIILAGDFTVVAGVNRGRIARLNTDGTLDTSFNPPGGANGAVYDVDLQTDGKLVLGGDFTGLNGASHERVGRLNADGSVDTSFNQTVDGTVRAVAVQSDGKILIGGSMDNVQGESHRGMARLNPGGSIDNSFTAYADADVHEVVLQSDSKILAGGEFILVNGFSAMRIARLQDTAVPVTTQFDYDGDGKADISVFRPATNRWYEFRSGSSAVFEQTFGQPGDIIAPADYDGDGKTDIGVFHPSGGDWWYSSSINGVAFVNNWGAAGDIPLPGDFDGDGKADFIVFRPAENKWYRFGSTGAVSIITFGIPGDKPVLGDFDGDGLVDLAIYRPSTGDWWYQSSINNAQIATRWGIATDTPAPADYDGDGKTDIAVYRESTGVWYIINSADFSFTIINFGLSEDLPVPADYDGDGKADIAVFRPGTRVWYLLNSTSGFSAAQFGLSTDIPTPNSFVP